MSGIGTSLADLDKTVNKEVPGGWVTVGALALGGAGAAGAFGAGGAGAAGASGAGAGGAGGAAAGAGATSAAGLAGGGAFIPAAGSGASFLVPEIAGAGALSGAAGGAVSGAPVYDFSTPAMLSPAGNTIPAGTSLTDATLMDKEIAAAGAKYATSSSISPMQAMMASKMMGSGQQQGGGQKSSSVGFKPGQPINSADPITALLAPKMKKKERISLL
jgi:hypothetical protein